MRESVTRATHDDRSQTDAGAWCSCPGEGIRQPYPITVVPADRELAELAAAYMAANVLAFADAFAVTLAQHRKAELVTSDHEFKAVDKGIKVVWPR